MFKLILKTWGKKLDSFSYLNTSESLFKYSFPEICTAATTPPENFYPLL